MTLRKTSTQPLLSVGLPVFNGGDLLENTLASILAQDYSRFEIIVVDNASTDATPDICRKAAARDSRIRYYRNAENVGAPRNYNATFKRAGGSYFKWTAVGDLCGDGMFSRCIEELERNACAVLAYPTTRLFEADPANSVEYDETVEGTLTSPAARFLSVKRDIRLNNIMNGIARRSVLLRTGLHGLFYGSDIVLMMELALRGMLVPVPEAYYYRRMTAETATQLQNRDAVARHWAPWKTSPLALQVWRRTLAQYAAVLRARPGFVETAHALLWATRFMVWQRYHLWKEVKDAIWYGFGSAARAGPKSR